MDIYRHFAQVYDAFMVDTPYEQWAGYIDNVLHNHGVSKGSLILDLACGTGTMAFLMAQKGYDLIGIDVSEDMLSEAYTKMYEASLNVLFLNQDMRVFELYGTVDAVYSSCDGLNYLLAEDDLEMVSKNVLLYLNPGGVFIFDLKMDCKYRQLGEDTFYDDIDDISYVWKNKYNPDTCINEYQVEFYFQGEESAEKTLAFIETHHQRAYDVETVMDILKQAGFGMISVYDNYTQNPAQSDSERLVFVAQK